jgi:Icc-related predicted phosphoesterase
MKILALSDTVVDLIYSAWVTERFADIDLIVGCGDLPAHYLEYVVTQLNVPLVYVPGNHDSDRYRVPGGVNIDGGVVRIAGVRIAGLGGSRRYKSDGRHQYTERQMFYRTVRLLLTLRARHGGLDVLVTHAPPFGVHDAQDLTHQGFEAFHRLLQMATPRLMLHGHVHAHPNLVQKETELYQTLVINVYPYQVVGWP